VLKDYHTVNTVVIVVLPTLRNVVYGNGIRDIRIDIDVSF